MEIEFIDTKLEKTVSPKHIIAKYGAERAKLIKRRLADLEAASSLAEMFFLPGKFHPLTGDQAGQFALNISPNYRLLLKPNLNPLPRKPDGGIDLTLISKVLIVEIGADYH